MKTCLHKNVYTNVHGSFIYNSPQNGNNLNVYRLMNGQTKCDASIPGNTAATRADPDTLCRILCDPVHMRHVQHANPWSKSAPRKVRSTFCKENSCLYLPITHSWLLSGLSSLRPPRPTALTSWLPTPQLFSPLVILAALRSSLHHPLTIPWNAHLPFPLLSWVPSSIYSSYFAPSTRTTPPSPFPVLNFSWVSASHFLMKEPRLLHPLQFRPI